MKTKKPNFVATKDIDAANNINLREYRFEKHSESEGYIFVRRANRMGID